MSIPDNLMVGYFTLATALPVGEVANLEKGLKEGELHPRDVKMQLAYELVRIYHGDEAAQEAEKEFQQIFQQRLLPTNIPAVSLSRQKDPREFDIITFLAKVSIVSSRSEARRMIQQGAVKINGERVQNIDEVIRWEDEMVLQVGKRRFVQIEETD